MIYRHGNDASFLARGSRSILISTFMICLFCLCGILLTSHAAATEGYAVSSIQAANEGSFPGEPSTYYFTWYDNVGAANWVLVANPINVSEPLYIDMSVAGQKKDFSQFALSGKGCPENGCSPGMVPDSRVLYARFPSVMGGPVEVNSLSSNKPIISQRTLWSGNSLEEVLGVEKNDLSDHYLWAWYDQQSPGFTDWILIANTNNSLVYYEIRIAGDMKRQGTIEPGKYVTPTFPGIMGGPVEVFAWSDAVNGNTPIDVMASQRVLSGDGTAFNEVPGIPFESLSNNYLWTWYDNVGASNWILLSNPTNGNVTYEIWIAGSKKAEAGLQPGEMRNYIFPATMGGPVEVNASGKVLASQRSIWGSSFEEVPGFSIEALSSVYHWTWYDMQSPGVSNWVLVANPSQNDTVWVEIYIGGRALRNNLSGNPAYNQYYFELEPGTYVTPLFPGLADGPVEVKAFKKASFTPANVFATQRILWNGFFNEVTGLTGPRTSGKVHGINFGPFMDGQDPGMDSQINETQIRNRLAIIAPYTEWIKTFSSTDGIEVSGRIAHEMNMKAACGAWLDDNLDNNQKEVQNLIAEAKAGNCDMAIVGSEVFLSNKISEQQLLQYLNQVKSELSGLSPAVPVTTAEIFDRLLTHPNVMDAVDVIAVNYYPFWWQMDINDAMRSLIGWHQQVSQAAGGKPVIITETGWPSGGGQLGAAVASPENAARYFSEFVSWAKKNNVQYFYFSAFDELWKESLSTKFGAHWGLWDKDGKIKPGMQSGFQGDLIVGEIPPNGILGGPGTAVIMLVEVPPYGTFDNLKGQVWHVDPSSYRVAVYIKVDGKWWIKPWEDSPETQINTDGRWECDVTTGGHDEDATEIKAYLIPDTYHPPALMGSSSLPSELEQNSVASTTTVR